MNELLSSIKDKKELLDHMYELSREQANLITEEKFEKLEDILDKKDNLIEEINKVDLKVKESSPQEQLDDKDLNDLQTSIKKLLSQIKSLDDQNNKRLEEAMSKMKCDIKDMRQGVRAMQNYSNNDPYESFSALGGTLFIDQDS